MRQRLLRGVCIAAGMVACLTAGCEDNRIEEYPRSDYYQDRSPWRDVVGKWRKSYPNAFIILPSRPWPKEFHSPALSRKSRWKIAVVGVVDGRGAPIRGTAGQPGVGSGVQDTARRMRWSDRLYDAARWIDPREALQSSLERQLAAIGGVTVVSRRDLKHVMDERDLKRMFASAEDLPKLKKLHAADAVLVARASELEYLIYSVDEVSKTRRTLTVQRARRATVSLRLIDVQTGDLLWSASVQYRPKHYLLAPVMVHHASGDLPPALRGVPKTDSAASDAAYMLIQRLGHRVRGLGGTPSIDKRRKLGTHLHKEW